MSVAFMPQKNRPPFNPSQYQRLLDENVQLIQAIVDYQNKGKVSECLQYKEIFHRNLVYLASVADAGGPSMQAHLPPPQSFMSGPPAPGQNHNSPQQQQQQQQQIPGNNVNMPPQRDGTPPTNQPPHQNMPPNGKKPDNASMGGGPPPHGGPPNSPHVNYNQINNRGEPPQGGGGPQASPAAQQQAASPSPQQQQQNTGGIPPQAPNQSRPPQQQSPAPPAPVASPHQQGPPQHQMPPQQPPPPPHMQQQNQGPPQHPPQPPAGYPRPPMPPYAMQRGGQQGYAQGYQPPHNSPQQGGPSQQQGGPPQQQQQHGSNKQEQMVIPLAMNIKEEIVPQEPEPEMSFLLCEEKVPASPVPLDPCPDKDEDEDTDYLSGKLKAFAKIPLASTSTTSFTGGTTTNDAPSTTAGLSFPHFSPAAATVPTSGERTANAAGPTVKQIETEMTTVLDNTPPTTPESSGSLLSSTPPHEDETQERPAEFKLMRTHPTREVECEDTSSRSTDSSSASTSSSGGLTSLSTTLGTDFPKPSYMSKRPKMDLDRHYEALPAKRRRKSGKANEPMKVPASKTLVTATGRPIKQERDAEITAVTSPNASPAKTIECSYSDSLFIDTSPPSTALQSSLIPPLNTASTTIPSLPIRPNRPSKFNFDDPLDDNADANKRINVLQERMTELRKTYMNLKAEVALIDRRRKKAKKKDKHSSGSGSGGASAVSTTSKDNSNHGNGNSGSPNVPLMDAQTS